MASPAENFFRFLGATETADRIRGPVSEVEKLQAQNIQSQIAARQLALDEARQQRQEMARRRQATQGYLGSLFDTQEIAGPMQPGQERPSISKFKGLGQEDLIKGLMQGADPSVLGTLQQLTAPSEIEEKLQMLGVIQSLPPQMQELYKGLYGKGGTTVNVGGESFQEKLEKNLADRVTQLDTEASDFYAESASAEQALNILQSNPNIDISPTSKISTQAKSLFAPFLSDEELKNVSDYQQLDSQLIRNRFDVTKVLKGAITEQEQAAAQRVAGTPTGTRQGLEQTLKNNIAYATLSADYRQKKADFIRQKKGDYSEKEFNQYYKALGETGQRPTLESLLGQISEPGGITFLGFE